MPTHFETTDAAGSASTSYTLANGQFLQGQVTSNGDQDWYAVSLIAGQSYIFSLVGTGSQNLQDPYLRLYGPGGSVQLASNDDGLVNQNSVIHFTASTSGTYFLAASAMGGGTGQYGLAMTTGPRAVFDAQMGAGALDADSSWATGLSRSPGRHATPLPVAWTQAAVLRPFSACRSLRLMPLHWPWQTIPMSVASPSAG